MRENRPSGLEGGARLNTSFLPLSIVEKCLTQFINDVQRRDSPGNEERSKLWSNGNNERFVVRERGHDRVWWKC
jgi:hypothetical protein